MTSQGAPIEMVEGEPVLRRSARALLGWLGEQEGVTTLLGRNPIPGEDVGHLREQWSDANRARTKLGRLEVDDPIVELDSVRLREVANRREIAASFHGMNWRPAVVDLRRVLSFQKLIHVDGLEERLVDAFNEDGLYEVCLPVKQPSPPAGAFTDNDTKGFTISSFNPNLRIAGGQITAADVSPGPDMPAVRMQAVTLLVYMGTSYLQVVRYRGRSFIRDGYHRAAGLLKRGIYQVPCIFIEAATFEQVSTPAGAFTYETLYGDERPPLIEDFWNDSLAADVNQVAVRKVIRVTGQEFVVPR